MHRTVANQSHQPSPQAGETLDLAKYQGQRIPKRRKRRVQPQTPALAPAPISGQMHPLAAMNAVQVIEDKYPSVRPRWMGQATPLRFLTTDEAAQYLRKSTSWLLRQGDIPYLPGRPNTYAIEDLDAWHERNKHQPLN